MLQMTRLRRSVSRTTGLTAAAFAAGIALVGFAAPAAASAISPEGIWFTEEHDSIIKVRPCVDDAGKFCGSIVWLKEPTESDGSPKVDKLNPDVSKRGNSMVGSEILVGMAEDGNHWTGHAYNPEDGKLYNITFTIKSGREANDTADLRGCVLRYLCKTSTFTRAAEVPGGEPALAAAPRKKNKKSAHQ